MFKVFFFGNPVIASKLIVVVLRNNNQRIALNKISRMDIQFICHPQGRSQDFVPGGSVAGFGAHQT